jgi:hypothetical protein
MRRAEWQRGEQKQRQADEGGGQCHGGAAPALSLSREPQQQDRTTRGWPLRTRRR